MMDTRSNQLVSADSMKELRDRIPPAARGPSFQTGEVVSLKGYGFRVLRLEEGKIVLAPFGPIKAGQRRAKGRKPAKQS